ncbi:hypothetical protein FNF27_05594 [Cafeteria roenbergensis]|uniref:Transmembrane protein 231 n=1 Tax=Cafeteria roenbergensis TaxID=33653 RepID=A0A5A8E801_CAFRO|nr:hypothetical protein FNF29_06131 [Cafeteria roenbergensis]KAA0172957.1 hypothetical protein FNF27_05594 [Cafeteria roenbergensis]|mmetsp:Transcript_16375/g.62143  ORF Transcript_16375/g.62143 Transcript_16375/m.62143 type:complete len:344 (+) Transcript_16375:102-1133(+)|eukprot:KAA0149244.1 hypothetical protein FNF29_06131 [Cafeteria roenbergensis]
MAYVVNTQLLIRRYRSGLCSGGCCLCVITVVATVLLPLFLGLASGSFWPKEFARYEQPDVVYQNDLVVFATGERLDATGALVPLAVAYSTSSRVQSLLGTSLRAPSEMRAAQRSPFGDSRMDVLELNITLPLATSERITAVDVLLPAQVKLHDVVRLDTASALVLSHAAGGGGAGVLFAGDVELAVRVQLPAGTRYLDPAAGEPALALSSATSLSDVTPAAVLRRLHGRNVTLHARVPSPLWTPDPSPTLRQPSADPGSAAGGFAGLGGGSRAFTIEVLLRVPPQPIWMRPTLTETLKLAWVQYLALLVPIWLLFWSLSCLVFDSGIVDAAADVDRVVKAKLH